MLLRKIFNVIYFYAAVYSKPQVNHPHRNFDVIQNGYSSFEKNVAIDDVRPTSWISATPSTPTIYITSADLPPGYVCLSSGSCQNLPSGDGIEIRIITPGNISPCPKGQIICTTSSPVSTGCGLRLATNISTIDGIASPGAFPWQVYMVNQTGYAGSGVLINEYHVLTAAHKVYMNGATPEMIGIYLGVHNTQQLGVRYTVQRVLLHPNFNPTNLFNDVALLRLGVPVAPLPQENVNTVCLPSNGQSFVGQSCWVAGWGQTNYIITNLPAGEKQQVQVPVVSYATCHASMSSASVLGANADRYLDPIGELCAGGQGSRDACTNDGGAPLVCPVNGRFVVAGLVLWGKGCGLPGVYGVYANISHYVNWITSSMAILNG